MRRREFITLLGGTAVAWPVAARAQQQNRVRRIGVLSGGREDDPATLTNLRALKDGLQKLGWEEARNIVIEYRFGAADMARYATLATELAALRLDVIVTNTTPALAALRQATDTIPIVFVQISDPVSAGFVPSLARPGGNMTGFSNFEYTIGGKWLQLLKEIVPAIGHVGVLFNPDDPSGARYLRAIEAIVPSFRVQLRQLAVREPNQIEPVVDDFAREIGGLVVFPTPVLSNSRDRIVRHAALHRLPAIYAVRFDAMAGGLMSYGPDPTDLHRRSADYIDRILRGAKAGDLPVQQPTKFQFIINLKTAKALNLTIPPGVLAIVDEVIE